jgi:hypothetical protein
MAFHSEFLLQYYNKYVISLKGLGLCRVPDVSSEGNEEDDHVIHGAADAEGLGMVVQAVATYSITFGIRTDKENRRI